MNLLDGILLGLAALLGYAGYRKGLIATLFSFVSAWLAALAAWYVQFPVSQWLMQEWPLILPQPWTGFTPWIYRGGVLLLLFVLFRYFFRAMGQFLRLVHWIPILSQADRLLGAALAISVLVIFLFLLQPFVFWLPSDTWKKEAEDSYWLNQIQALPIESLWQREMD